MEQLRALGAQLLAIWSQLGVNQKLTVAASGFIVAVTLAVVVFFTSRTDFVLLYGGLDPKDAGDVVAVLEEQSVLYEAGAGGTSICRRRVDAGSRRKPSCCLSHVPNPSRSWRYLDGLGHRCWQSIAAGLGR